MDCIFCRIGSGEIGAYVIVKKPHVVSFLDAHPHAPGHSVVIPTAHVVNFTDLPDDFLNDFLAVAQETTKKLSRGVGTTHFTIGINEGKSAGRAIDHLHLHIIPRFPGDEGGSIHGVVNNPPKESLEEIYQSIMAAR